MTRLNTGQPTRGRGRPTIRQDNQRVQTFLSEFLTASELIEAHPIMDDVLTGAVLLETEGEKHARPLSKGRVFRVLRACEVIDTAAVANVLSTGFKAISGKSTIARYAAAARVCANAIGVLLATNPAWETMKTHSE
ncbi:MAG: hypothetical protein EOO70_08190, partial [Myxococcaceae bacterium]